MSQYTYDDKGQYFPFVVLTFLSMVLIPMTYSLLKPTSTNVDPSNKTNKESNTTVASCTCHQCHLKYGPVGSRKKKNSAQAAAARRSAGQTFPVWKWTFVIVGWAVFAFFVYKVQHIVVDNKLWDPYQILGLKMSATEREVKKHFKRLSLKFHPDKLKSSLNQTKEEIAAKFVELTKAYKALTDEEVRRNYLEFGHPDGKQEFSMSIALPTWIVESQNNFYVLGVYGIVFGLLLPYFVQKWWYGSRMLTKDGIQNDTAGHYFINMKENMKFPQLLDVFASSQEFKLDIPQRSTDASKVQKLNMQARGQLFQRHTTRMDPGKKFNSIPWSQKASALLLAYLLRVEVQDEDLKRDQRIILTKAILLQNALLQMAIARSWLSTSLLAMSLSQALHQAAWVPGDSDLLQLPNITFDIVSNINKGRRKRISDIAGLMSLEESDRRDALKELDDKQYKQTISIAKQIPKLDVPNMFFKVLGEKTITPGALVTFVMKMRLLHPGQTPPKVPAKHLEEVLEEDEHEHCANGEHKHAHEDKKPVEHLVHAPRLIVDETAIEDDRGFPAVTPQWWILLGDVKMNKIVVPPIKVPIDVGFAEVDDDENSIKTVKVQFQAPPESGIYTFVTIFKCDSYMGSDFKKETQLKVEDPDDDEGQEGAEDDISEPDEDSIAGQMQQMRGRPARKPRKRYQRESDGDDDEEDDDDDDQSSSEEETDTDTDTDTSDSDSE